MTEALTKELESWKFLDSWDGFLPWKTERHLAVKKISDTSNFGWGGILSLPVHPKYTKDYFMQEDLEGIGIAVKEAKALFKTL